jgi:hypothetical protein
VGQLLGKVDLVNDSLSHENEIIVQHGNKVVKAIASFIQSKKVQANGGNWANPFQVQGILV